MIEDVAYKKQATVFIKKNNNLYQLCLVINIYNL